MSFNNFNFHPQINAGISAAGYSTPSPIQASAIPAILEGRDVLGLAQTGTGKTAAFVLPMLQHLIKGPRGKQRALILAPTRELAEQTHTAITHFGKLTGLRSITVYGGVSAQPQIRGIRSGAEIIVACPGRLLDLKNQGVIRLNDIEILVLDEADHMFDMGFLPSIRAIIGALPKQRQTLLFSATMPTEIRSLAGSVLKDPITVEISIEQPLDTITHALYTVDQTRKPELLMELLKDTGSGQVLVFTRTKHRAKKLSVQLAQAGFKATSLQGNLSQAQRQVAMNAFRSGHARVMVATDIAARGIDVSQVSHVINFDIPDTVEAYTHRTGRTGRMERLGNALSLVTREDLPMVAMIEKLMGKKIERRSVEGIPQERPPIVRPAAQMKPRPQNQQNNSNRNSRYAPSRG